MADVYVGRHTTLNTSMAVKILHAHMMVNQDLRRRFRDEAQAVATLRHPNIVQVIDFDVVDDQPYIVMELLEGMPLSEYLRGLHSSGHTLPLDTVSHLVTLLSGALDYAHERQIVHRDVKPANIILRAGTIKIQPQMPLAPDVEPILTDFGVARLATSTTPTASGTILGTPAYMSPEQVRGEAVDRRSDIYSLGIVLYEILAGKLPFSPEDTPASILYKHVHEDPPIVPDVSPALQRVVEKSLAKDRDARYQQAGQMAADLQGATRRTPAADSTEPMRTQVGTAQTAAADSTPAEPAESQRRRPGLLVAALGIGAIVLVGGVLVGGQLMGAPDGAPAGAPTSAPAATPAAADVIEPTSPPVSGDTPTEIAPPSSGPVGLAVVRDHELQAQLPTVSEPPAGRSYHAWILRDDGGEPIHINRDGIVDYLGGNLTVSYSAPSGTNLLASYPTFVVSLEGEGSLLVEPSEIVLQGTLNPETISMLRLADEVKRGDPVIQNLSQWLPSQVSHFITHSGFSLDGVARGDLNYVKTHSEHSLNIIEGRDGEYYDDWDGNQRAENPGDDVGLFPYIMLLGISAEGGAKAEILRGGSGEAGNAIAERSDEIGELLFSIRETMRQILLVDTVADIQSFGLDSDLEIQREAIDLVKQLVTDSDQVDLAFAIEIFPVR